MLCTRTPIGAAAEEERAASIVKAGLCEPTGVILIITSSFLLLNAAAVVLWCTGESQLEGAICCIGGPASDHVGSTVGARDRPVGDHGQQYEALVLSLRSVHVRTAALRHIRGSCVQARTAVPRLPRCKRSRCDPFASFASDVRHTPFGPRRWGSGQPRPSSGSTSFLGLRER